MVNKASGGTSGGCAHELICRVEGDGALGPPERAHGLELGEDCIHFTSKLFKDTLRGWGLGYVQDAGDSSRLPEAPNPLVLMVVVIPSRWWRQRGKTGVALRAWNEWRPRL